MSISSSPPSAKPDAKTARILAASEQLFLESGYTATSMNRVATRAGVSKTTLYSRFASKEELFVATIQEACRRYGVHIIPECFDDLPLEDALFEAARPFVDMLWSPEAIKIRQSAVSEALRMPEVGKLYFRAGPERFIAGFTTLFERIARRDSRRFPDPAFAARQFLATLLGDDYCALELGLSTPPTDEERSAFTRRAVTLFVHGING